MFLMHRVPRWLRGRAACQTLIRECLPMVPRRLGIRSILALSCVGFLASTGCVSQERFARVEQERQRLSTELAQQQDLIAAARQEKAAVSSQLDAALAQ